MRVYGKQVDQTAVGDHLPPDVIGVIANYLPRSWRHPLPSAREQALAEFNDRGAHRSGKVVRLIRASAFVVQLYGGRIISSSVVLLASTYLLSTH